MPDLTIITPVYNDKTSLKSAIISTRKIKSSTQIIIINDGSDDGSAEVIEGLSAKDARILAIHNTKRIGASASRNIGIKLARGQYICFLDSDDQLIPESIDLMLSRAKITDCDAIKGIMNVKRADGSLIPHPLNQKSSQESRNLKTSHQIQHLYQYQSYLIKREILENRNILFNSKLSNFQDPEFLSRALPECSKIEVTTHNVYVKGYREDSITNRRWSKKNYLSLIEGTSDAYFHLVAKDLKGPAREMALTIDRWWWKLSHITEFLPNNECFEIYRKINIFFSKSGHRNFYLRAKRPWSFLVFILLKHSCYHSAHIMIHTIHVVRSFLLGGSSGVKASGSNHV